MIDIRCGNSLTILDELADNSIDLIVTDPPYKVTSRGCAGTSGGMLQKKINKQGKVFQHNKVNIKDYASDLYRVLKNGSHCYIMCNHKNLQEMLNTLTSVGFHFTKCLIWNKSNKIMGQFYMSQFEYILFLRKGKAKKINHCGTSDIINIANIKTKNEFGKNIHDTEKPIELMEILIKNSSNKNDLILDPFMGVGSTGIACKNLKRRFLGIEIDSTYFELSKQRMQGG